MKRQTRPQLNATAARWQRLARWQRFARWQRLGFAIASGQRPTTDVDMYVCTYFCDTSPEKRLPRAPLKPSRVWQKRVFHHQNIKGGDMAAQRVPRVLSARRGRLHSFMEENRHETVETSRDRTPPRATTLELQIRGQRIVEGVSTVATGNATNPNHGRRPYCQRLSR